MWVSFIWHLVVTRWESRRSVIINLCFPGTIASRNCLAMLARFHNVRHTAPTVIALTSRDDEQYRQLVTCLDHEREKRWPSLCSCLPAKRRTTSLRIANCSNRKSVVESRSDLYSFNLSNFHLLIRSLLLVEHVRVCFSRVPPAW